MVTTATHHCCKWVLGRLEAELPQVKVVHFWIDSFVSGDKQPAAIHLLQTRGVHATAEAWIPESILKSVLKVRCACMRLLSLHLLHPCLCPPFII